MLGYQSTGELQSLSSILGVFATPEDLARALEPRHPDEVPRRTLFRCKDGCRLLQGVLAGEPVDGGAVALVSGRAIADLDSLFAPLTLPSAGLHGFEHRGAAGAYRRRPAPSTAALESARGSMLYLARQHPGLRVEDKGFALALHYRDAPQLEQTALAAMLEIAARTREELELQRGKMVVELRPAGATKARAVAAFLAEAPFRGRMPIFIGDDLTDEPAFELVNRLGGLSAVVNAARPSAALTRLTDVAAVRGWLAQLQADPPCALGHLSAHRQGLGSQS